ncbi:hypothetical protein BT67DRAFT_233123 [Trichocladium antarcticum]|uniref:Uncharacterized protein n=1 Tax=Trichocladium antarcticum TaxID=1450529 RepID=A0AAN6UNJ1_9PEZI|nr:hypothetical protein BT67DRAFT_233123 [Trichocladium antarcticum]
MQPRLGAFCGSCRPKIRPVSSVSGTGTSRRGPVSCRAAVCSARVRQAGLAARIGFLLAYWPLNSQAPRQPHMLRAQAPTPEGKWRQMQNGSEFSQPSTEDTRD